MSQAHRSYLVHQFIPLIFCVAFGIGFIVLGYSLALLA